jgi:multidrug resistance efflux pump
MRELVAEGEATIADAQVAQQRAQAAQSAYLRAQMEAVQAAAQVVPPPPPDTGPTYDQLALAAEIHSLERTIDLGTLRAPFAGRVVSVSISPDSSVAAEQTTMIVEHPQAPRIVAYLAPNDAAAAKIGREAEVDFPGHGVLPAHVLAVTGVTQPSGALETTLTLDKPLPADERIENYPVYVHFPRLAMLSLPLRS